MNVEQQVADAVAKERERCASLCEDRAIHQNGMSIVSLEMNNMAKLIRGQVPTHWFTIPRNFTK